MSRTLVTPIWRMASNSEGVFRTKSARLVISALRRQLDARIERDSSSTCIDIMSPASAPLIALPLKRGPGRFRAARAAVCTMTSSAVMPRRNPNALRAWLTSRTVVAPMWGIASSCGGVRRTSSPTCAMSARRRPLRARFGRSSSSTCIDIRFEPSIFLLESSRSSIPHLQSKSQQRQGGHADSEAELRRDGGPDHACVVAPVQGGGVLHPVEVGGESLKPCALAGRQ